MKKKKIGIRLWKRDYDILRDLEHGLYSSGQLARLYFSSAKKCAERMKRLYDAGLVGRFPRPLLNVRGKPEFVYCGKGKTVRGFSKVEHGLAASEFYVLWKEWLGGVKGLDGVFSFDDTLPRLFGGALIPDGVFVLSRGSKKLLFFVEVDCGSESLSSFGAYGFADKFGLYAELFDSERYREIMGYTVLAGFRVLVIFRSEQRLKNFLDLAVKNNYDFVLASTFQRVQKFSVGGRCWSGVYKGRCDIFGKE